MASTEHSARKFIRSDWSDKSDLSDESDTPSSDGLEGGSVIFRGENG